VEKNGAPRGEKFLLFVNPPVVNAQLGIRRSYLAETRACAIEFLKRGLQLIVFAQSRLSTELLTTYMKRRVRGAAGIASDDVFAAIGAAICRCGRRENRTRPPQRRSAVRGVHERARAGHRHRRARRGGDGGVSGHDRGHVAARGPRRPPVGRIAAVLVASSAPIDQFVVRNPDYFFDASPNTRSSIPTTCTSCSIT
jgi:DEAD/DEAH box helicase domain-containing protein